MLLRDRDINTAWKTASDGVLETRHLFCQNWRADVSAVMNSNGTLVEWVKYRAYGAPFSMPVGDTDSDGDKDATDESTVSGWSSGYDVRADLDLDGDIDFDDYILAGLVTNSSQGYAALSSADVENRKGYAGYENSYEILRFNHVRYRVMDTGLGRWTRRVPIGYVDGANLAVALAVNPVCMLDPMGLNPWDMDSPPSNPAPRRVPRVPRDSKPRDPWSEPFPPGILIPRPRRDSMPGTPTDNAIIKQAPMMSQEMLPFSKHPGGPARPTPNPPTDFSAICSTLGFRVFCSQCCSRLNDPSQCEIAGDAAYRSCVTTRLPIDPEAPLKCVSEYWRAYWNCIYEQDANYESCVAGCRNLYH